MSYMFESKFALLFLIEDFYKRGDGSVLIALRSAGYSCKSFSMWEVLEFVMKRMILIFK